MAITDTQRGQNLSDAYDSVRKLLTQWLPAHQTSLNNLANRPIGG